jgi:NAD(P)-dependent dehydrogenase (short-subunit alcohol dehydrogenase family)
MLLSGKRALVTGAQQGIGRASAVALAKAGAAVAVNWFDDEGAAFDVKRQIESDGGACTLVRADLAAPGGVVSMFECLPAGFGDIDILVNNAGIFPRVAFLDLDEPTWDRTHAINLKAATFCAQHVARSLVARGAAGSIINMASMSVRGSPRGTHYSATKGGMLSMTRAAALELAPYGIRVNAIAPGVVDTAQPRAGFGEDEIEAMGRSLPIGRIGRTDEIADIVVFLASDASSFIVGEIIHANGGAYMA